MPYIGNNHIAGDHTNNFKVLDDISSFTATFDGSASSVVDTTNNTIRAVEHRFIQGQRVTYTNGGGGNIGGLTSGTAYFVIFDSASTIKLATSASNAANSTAINLSAVGTGSSHTINAAFDGVNTKFKLTHSSGTGARLNNATQINIAINNVVQRPNLDPNNFTDGFALEDNHKIVFKTAPTSEDIFWGSIIANTLTTFDISDHKIDTFTGDGSTTEFTLSHTPANNESLMVTINGVLQHPSNASTARAYTLIASIIQFTAAPANGDEIQVRHLGFAGATTADVSGFYGRTGNVVLGSTDHITTGDITARNINASGILTASSASFGGNVSIGGTLTYEDVSNIDSVGIITARDGIDCNGDLDVDGHTNLDNVSVAGVSTFSGIVAAGIGSTAITLGNNHKITLGSAHELELHHDGSNSYIKQRFFAYPSRLKIISENSGIDIMSGSGGGAHGGYENAISCENNGKVKIYHAGVGPALETNGDGVTVAASIWVGAYLKHNSDLDTKFGFPANDTISFDTAGSERLRIDSSGRVMIGTTTEGSSSADTLTIAESGNSGITIRSGTSNGGHIYFSDGTSGADEYRGIVFYDHTSNYMSFWTNGDSEKLRIDSSGRVMIGTDTEGVGGADELTIANTSSSSGITIRSSTTATGNIYFSDGTSGADEYRGVVRYDHSNNDMSFWTNGSEKFRILDTGNVGIGTDNPTAKLQLEHSGLNAELFRTWTTTGSIRREYFLKGPASGNGNDPYRWCTGNSHSWEVDGTERLRIDSNGRVLIGTTTPGSTNGDDLTIATSGDTGMTIRSGNTSDSTIYFADTDSDIIGYMQYDHNNNSLKTIVNSTQAVHIDNDLKVSLGKGSFGGMASGVVAYGNRGGIRKDSLTVLNATASVAGRGAGVAVGGNTGVFGSFYGKKSGSADSSGGNVFLESIGDISFITGGDMTTAVSTAPQLFIDSAGNMSLGKGSAASTNYTTQFQIHSTNSTGAALHLTNSTSGSSNSDGFHLVQQTHIYYWLREDAHQIFGTNSTERLRITSGGDMGLGTDSPNSYSNQRVFTINGTNLGRLDLEVSGTLKGSVWADGGGLGLDAGGNELEFYAGNAERLRIASNGLHTINATTYDALTINTTDNGTNGPQVQLTHISSSPAAGDYVGQLRFTGRDSAGNSELYGRISTIIDDPTTGQETGHLQFSTKGYSSFNTILRLKNRGTASAPSYTTDDTNGIILDVYNTGNPYPRYMNFIAKSGGNTDSNIAFWTEAVGGSPTEKLRITSSGAVMINTTNSSSRTLNLNGTFGILSTNQSGVLDMSVTDAGEASIGPYVAGGSTLTLKTNSSGSGVAERLRITSTGAFYIKSPSSSTGDQPGEIQWWNENGAGVMAKIGVYREGSTNAPSGLKFYTTQNVDTAANNSQGNITERFFINSEGKFYKGGNQFYPVIQIHEARLSGPVSNSATGSYQDIKNVVTFTPKKVGSMVHVQVICQTWNGSQSDGSSDAYARLQHNNGGSYSTFTECDRVQGNFQYDERYHHSPFIMDGWFTTTTLNSTTIKFQGNQAAGLPVAFNWFHSYGGRITLMEYDIT